jgi:hypothetical protein
VNARSPSLALFNIGGGEIILIFVLFLVLAVAAVAFLGLIYLIVRAVQARPPSTPSSLPPDVWIQNQQKRDQEHLKLLSIFHFVFGGLALLGIGFLGVHYFIMHTVFSNPDMWNSHKAPMPPKAFLDAFIWFYLFMGLLLLAGFVLNVLSGLYLRQKKHRFFSLIVGGLNCLQIPFGTALGVFTIIVLTRDSVRQRYSD